MRILLSPIQYFVLLGALLCTAPLSAQEQSDAPQTLRWAEGQANRVDSLLHDAMRGSESIEVLLRLMDCYLIFDAVAITGLYCTEARAAAEAGRDFCDVVNYRLDKDKNAALERAVEARRQAIRLRTAVQTCGITAAPSTYPSTAFTPDDVLRADAQMAEFDLTDGLAAKDFHILAQKIEHATRLLHDVEHLAATMPGCQNAARLAGNAIQHCRTALSAPNWQEIHRAMDLALQDLRALQTVACF
jgi:hypothetical protein